MASHRTPKKLFEALGRFIEFDEDFIGVGCGEKEEVDAGAVGAGTCGGIDRLRREGGAENFRGAVDISAAVLDLLDAFPKLLKEFSDGAIASGILGGEDFH